MIDVLLSLFQPDLFDDWIYLTDHGCHDFILLLLVHGKEAKEVIEICWLYQRLLYEPGFFLLFISLIRNLSKQPEYLLQLISHE